MASVPQAHGSHREPVSGAFAQTLPTFKGLSRISGRQGWGRTGRCRFKDGLRVPAAGCEDAAVTSRPRPAGCCSSSSSSSSGPGAAGPGRAEHRAGSSPTSERDASWLEPQVPPFPPGLSAQLPALCWARGSLGPRVIRLPRLGLEVGTETFVLLECLIN